MNIDDPKLTAFALDELDEPERSAVARAVAESVAAQQLVGEIRKLSDVIKNEFAAETQTNVVTALGSPEEPRTATGLQPQSLSDIRDDPWFWSIGRPLAIAAILTIFGIIAGVTFWPRQNSTRFAGPINLPLAKPADVQGEFQMLSEVEPSLPAKVPAVGHSPPAHPAMVAKQSSYKFRGYMVGGAEESGGIRQPGGQFNTATCTITSSRTRFSTQKIIRSRPSQLMWTRLPIRMCGDLSTKVLCLQKTQCAWRR